MAEENPERDDFTADIAADIASLGAKAKTNTPIKFSISMPIPDIIKEVRKILAIEDPEQQQQEMIDFFVGIYEKNHGKMLDSLRIRICEAVEKKVTASYNNTKLADRPTVFAQLAIEIAMQSFQGSART